MTTQPAETFLPAPSERLLTPSSEHWMLFLIHDAMRIDTVRLALAVAALSPDDQETAERLSAWFAGFRGAIEAHHHAEDSVFFPALAARAGRSFADHDTLSTDHHRLDELFDDIAGELGALATAGRHRASVHARLVTDIAGFKHLLGTHLAVEEANVVGLMNEHFDADTSARLRRDARAMHSLRDMRFIAPWIAAHADAHQHELLELESTVAVRVFERLVRRRYHRLDAVLPPLH